MLEFMRFRAHQSPSKHSSTIRLAVFQRRHLAIVDRADGQPRELRNAAHVRREPAAAQVIFQQPVDAVHVAAQRPAGDDQMLADGANHVSFRAEGGEIDGRAQRPQMGVVAEDDFARAKRLLVGDDRQLRAGHLFEERLQFLGAVPGRGRGVVGQDDLIGRLAVFGQHQLGGRGMDGIAHRQCHNQRCNAIGHGEAPVVC